MQFRSIIDTFISALVHPKVFRHHLSYLFVVSHVRSRSTLLSHILGSHPKIEGYLEWGKEYKSKKDFIRLRLQSWKEFKWHSPQYLMDKVLYKELIPTAQCLMQNPTKCILLIRNPRETIRSKLAASFEEDEITKSSPEWITNYYCEMTQEIVNLARQLPEKQWMFVDSKKLIENPNDILKEIQIFLELEEPLTTNYQIYGGTGNPQLGDSTRNIKAGKILNLDKTRYDNIVIENHFLEKAEQAFEEACESIKQLQVKN